MSKSESFEPVVWPWFIKEDQTWNSAHEIEDKVACQVVQTDTGKVFVSSRVFDKVDYYFKNLNDINR